MCFRGILCGGFFYTGMGWEGERECTGGNIKLGERVVLWVGVKVYKYQTVQVSLTFYNNS